MSATENLSPHQFFHGSSTSFEPGALIDPSQPHEATDNISRGLGQVWFTSDIHRARFHADRSSRKTGRSPHVYEVEPTGPHFQDLQTRRVPENRMTKHPLRVVGERR